MKSHAILSCMLLAIAPPAARADVSRSGSATTNDRTTQLWEEGKAAVLDERWEDAWLAFKQAYALNPTNNIRYNLALAALRTDRHVLAARLMRETLADCDSSCPEQIRETTPVRLREAETQVGRLRVETTGAARILVDGESVDQSVAEDVWHVAPGAHEIVVQVGKRSERRTVEVGAGQLAMVEIEFNDPQEALSKGVATNASGAEETRDHEPSIDREQVVVIGAAATAVSLGIATGFTLKARSANDHATDLREELGGSTDHECSSAPASQCAQLAAANDRREQAATAAAISWAATGVLGAATVATYFLWPNTESTNASSIVPVASTEFQGIMLQGAF